MNMPAISLLSVTPPYAALLGLLFIPLTLRLDFAQYTLRSGL
jgi:hypothetical protein